MTKKRFVLKFEMTEAVSSVSIILNENFRFGLDGKNHDMI